MNAYKTGGDYGFANRLVHIHMPIGEFRELGERAAREMFLCPTEQADFLRGWNEMNVSIPPHPESCPCWICNGTGPGGDPESDDQSPSIFDSPATFLMLDTDQHALQFDRLTQRLTMMSDADCRTTMSEKEAKMLQAFLHKIFPV